MTVQYIARLTCACGATAELPVDASIDRGYSGYSGCDCKVELDCDYWSLGWWTGGGSARDQLECPACKEKSLA